jgi:hypothetical protein
MFQGTCQGRLTNASEGMLAERSGYLPCGVGFGGVWWGGVGWLDDASTGVRRPVGDGEG